MSCENVCGGRGYLLVSAVAGRRKEEEPVCLWSDGRQGINWGGGFPGGKFAVCPGDQPSPDWCPKRRAEREAQRARHVPVRITRPLSPAILLLALVLPPR